MVPTLWWGSDERADLADGTYLTGGIERGERCHVPGSMFWIRPKVFRDLLLHIYEAMRRRGFRAIVVVAGHWSPNVYLPTVRGSGEELQSRHPDTRWLLVTDQEVVPDLHYPYEHAAGGETSLLMAIRPDLVDLGKALETDGLLAAYYAGEPRHLARRRTTRHKYIGLFTGVEDDSNDPELTASTERGQSLLLAISQRIADRAVALLADAGSVPTQGRPA